jgi:hypothetical protein
MKFRPLHDRVVVKRIEAEEKSASSRIPLRKSPPRMMPASTRRGEL